MANIKEVKSLTQNKYLNMYEIQAENKVNAQVNYYVASRAKSVQEMKLKTRKVNSDGVIVYSLYGDKKDKVVLVKQYRYSIDDYIYEFPAGLVDPGEDYATAAVRELQEETGLMLTPIEAPEGFEKPAFTSVGMSDEACATVFGYASGSVSKSGQEDNEEIEIVLATRDEVRRILREENVAIMCAYMLMHFLNDEEPFSFLGIGDLRRGR